MADLLGSNSSSSSGTDNIGAQRIIATKVTASATGTVDTVSFRIASVNTYALTLALGVYDATGTSGGPGALLGSQQTVSLASGNGSTRYVTSSSGVGAAVTSGNTYWIAALGTTSSANNFQWDNATGNGGAGGTTNGLAFNASTVESSLPATFPTISFTAETANAFASDSGGAAVISFFPHRMPLGA